MVLPFIIELTDELLMEIGVLNKIGERREKYNDYLRKGSSQFNEIKKTIKNKIENVFSCNEINGTKLQAECFPDLSRYTINVFLSHSHGDIKDVEAFAGWLKENLDLTSFIDADVWSDIKDLESKLNEIANVPYNFEGKTIYDYNNTRLMFQHTNAMLSVALCKMIDNAEIAIFLVTPNSIKMHENNRLNQTFSPWIYTELSYIDLIRRKSILESRKKHHLLEESMTKTASLNIGYDVNYESVIKLTAEDLLSVKRQYNLKIKGGYIKKNGENALDILYRRKHPKLLKG